MSFELTTFNLILEASSPKAGLQTDTWHNFLFGNTPRRTHVRSSCSSAENVIASYASVIADRLLLMKAIRQ
jgi:hypothetical protein